MELYQDPNQPFAARVDDLVSRLTLEEKVAQMTHESPAIERLGVPAYNWWNECLHGVARAGVATVFPQAIGMAATFDPALIRRVATAISDEGRARYHELSRRGDRGIYKGLTFWTPNINIFRDPRWGRGHETYGEDPYLTGRIGVAFVQGLQGDDPKYLKSVGTPKHYAVHSGPEADRHSFNSVVSRKDLRETYLPAFRDCVRDANAWSIMGAYNRTNGEPCCGSHTLLQEILRDEWGFAGYVVSDCGAIGDFHEHHKVTASPPESAAMAVRNGCDLNCGRVYPNLVRAVQDGLISEAEIDIAVKRLFLARFKLGMFDPDGQVPYAAIPYTVNDCPAHRELALDTARRSIVLLKNAGKLLPLRRDLPAIAVIGPNADAHNVLLGNYAGTPSRFVTVLQGIQDAVAKTTRVYYAPGCELTRKPDNPYLGSATRGFAEALAAASRAAVTVMVMGLSPELEGEQGDAGNSDAAGDRLHLDLPDIQQELLEAVVALGRPVVLVLMSGSAVAINWAQDHVPAMVEAWYPGGRGGTAVAEVLFGRTNPSGRLPVTFPKAVSDLPDFRDYAMRGRTYRYQEAEPLYPFGYGLSYTQFRYANLALSRAEVPAGRSLTATIEVTNSGHLAGEEVVQLYVRDLEASVTIPHHELRGIQRVRLRPGQTRRLRFRLTARDLALIDDDGNCVLEPGRFRVYIGGSQPDARSAALTGQAPLAAEFTVIGKARAMRY